MAETFSVTSQRPGTTILPDARVVEVMEIGITTKPSGIPLTIKVPLDLYTPEYVARKADEIAQQAEAVHAL